MSLAQLIEISCDAPGCDETFTADGVGRMEARRQAAAEGWRRTTPRGSAPRDDLCPAHTGGATRTLPCTICGEPVEVPASARQASHGARCPQRMAERSAQLQRERLVTLGDGLIAYDDLLAAGLLHA